MCEFIMIFNRVQGWGEKGERSKGGVGEKKERKKEKERLKRKGGREREQEELERATENRQWITLEITGVPPTLQTDN